MTYISNIARSAGDPKIISTGPSSFSGWDSLSRGLGWFSLGLGILASRCRQRVLRIHIFNRAIDPVVLMHPRQMPLHDLRDGVSVGRIQGFELRDRYLKQVVIHLRLNLRGKCLRRSIRDCQISFGWPCHQHRQADCHQ